MVAFRTFTGGFGPVGGYRKEVELLATDHASIESFFGTAPNISSGSHFLCASRFWKQANGKNGNVHRVEMHTLTVQLFSTSCRF